jgi:MoaA/NifB/PqqE/SkfB family radical SAM enzyme
MKKYNNTFIRDDKIFYHSDRFNNWKKEKEVYPITVEIHLTERCNNRCFYCNYTTTQESMRLEDFKVAIQKLTQTMTKAIILSGGGEPLLHPNVSDAIKIITKAGMNSAIITNLSIKDENLYVTILKNCSWCRISFDASNATVYKKIREVDGFELVNGNVQHLVKLKNKLKSQTTIGVQSVINRYNIDDVFDEIKLAAKLEVDYIQIRPIETMPSEQLAYSKRQYDRVMKQIDAGYKFERKDFKIIRSDKWDVINPYLKERRHGFSFCHVFKMIAAVDVRGDVYVCCHQIEKRNKDLCYGNILKEDINLIMSRRKKVIKNLDLSKCYLECRGSHINHRLENLRKSIPHVNFL